MLHPIEILHWLEVVRNRPRGEVDPGAFWSLYEHDERPLTGMPASLAAAPHGPALLVVVTTYKRPEACAALLASLEVALQSVPRRHVLVLNDRADADYGETKRAAAARFGADLTWLDARERLGKPGFWKSYQTAFLAAAQLAPAHALFLQDDVDFAPTLLADVAERWRATDHDRRRRVLYLFSSDDDERLGRWVPFRRRDVGHGLRLTQWLDLQAFYVDRAFFELLAYRMVPIHSNRFRRRPWISSGVGAQLTRRLFRRGHVYQAYPPLVGHGALASEMNVGARRFRSLDNRALREADTKVEPSDD